MEGEEKKFWATKVPEHFTSRQNDSSNQLQSGVNFTNIFTRSFCARWFWKHKNTDDLTVFFTLLGSVRVKAVHRMLMKLSPDIKENSGDWDFSPPKDNTSSKWKNNKTKKTNNVDQMSISSTFYAQLFRPKFWRQQNTKLKLYCKAECFSFVIFGAKILQKSTRKMLMKLTPVEVWRVIHRV